jgi:hypothetical protein
LSASVAELAILISPEKIDALIASADLTLASTAAVTSDTGLLETCNKKNLSDGN